MINTHHPTHLQRRTIRRAGRSASTLIPHRDTDGCKQELEHVIPRDSAEAAAAKGPIAITSGTAASLCPDPKYQPVAGRLPIARYGFGSRPAPLGRLAWPELPLARGELTRKRSNT